MYPALDTNTIKLQLEACRPCPHCFQVKGRAPRLRLGEPHETVLPQDPEQVRKFRRKKYSKLPRLCHDGWYKNPLIHSFIQYLLCTWYFPSIISDTGIQ